MDVVILEHKKPVRAESVAARGGPRTACALRPSSATFLARGRTA